MKCCFEKCKEKAKPGLNGTIEIHTLEIRFPVCTRHWILLGKLEEKKVSK